MKKQFDRFRNYIFDPSFDLQDRLFVLFSGLVLLSLYIAVPFGLVMYEPVSATVSTFVGAVLITIYVAWAQRNRKMAQAKIVLSIVAVLIFLPAMFFTNGGAESGAPVWMILGGMYIGFILEGRMRNIMLTLFAIALGICWIVGYLYPGLVTEYSRGQNYFDAFAGMVIVGGIMYMMILFCISLYRREEKRKNLHRLFEQTTMALANAIDAKDEYTRGHSTRVAKYSGMIAERLGKSRDECWQIYYIALLHDVGKIGVDKNIINKRGRLTDEEYDAIKQHPVMGAHILESIEVYPDLVIGAKYHHERWDGSGYPEGLAGDAIPETARIISVADAYDAMTSRRSYRGPFSQERVREELLKCSGTQFDPDIVQVMTELIDQDTEYEMREQ